MSSGDSRPQRPSSAPTGGNAHSHQQQHNHLAQDRPLLYSLSPRRPGHFTQGGASRAIRGVYGEARQHNGDVVSDDPDAPAASATAAPFLMSTSPANEQQQFQQPPPAAVTSNDRVAAAATAACPGGSPTHRIMQDAVHQPRTVSDQQQSGAGSLNSSFRSSSRWPTRSVVEPLTSAPGYFDVTEPRCEFTHDIGDWNFDAFAWADKLGSPAMVYEAAALKLGDFLGVFVAGGCDSEIACIDRQVFINLLRAVGPLHKTEKTAPPVHYHTVLQSACRSMALGFLLSKMELLDVMNGVERAAILAASLVADVGHPGRNSQFLSAINDPVALRYNGVCPLEQFSCSLFFTILQQEEGCDITATMPDEQLRHFRTAVSSFVLATELHNSVEMVAAFESKLVSGALRPLENVEHRRETLGALLHAADINNQARPPLVAAKWSRCIHREFSLQHEDEVARGLPPSAGFSPSEDRTRLSVGFIDQHVLPLYDAVARLQRKPSGGGPAPVLAAVAQLKQNRTVLASRAGVDEVVKSRWPALSIAEPIPPPPPGKMYQRPERTDLLSAADLRDWNFDAFAMAEKLGGAMSLFMNVGCAIATEFGLLKGQSSATGLIERAKFEDFLYKLGITYRPNYYHCLTHACDVTAATYALLNFVEPPLLPHMDHVQRLGILLSALAHDAGHPGRNNVYMNNIRDPIAVRYNSQSTLESFHCSVLFSLLRDPAFDITTQLSASELNRLWKFATHAILGTDMSLHQVHLEDFDKKISSGALDPWQDAADRDKVLAIIMHSADISNPTRIPSISAQWDKAVSEEFFAQGDDEAANGLPISPGMNRQAANPVAKAKGTLFFVDFYLHPLYLALAKIMRPSAPMLDNLAANRAAAAERAGAPAAAKKARWPQTSVVEPVRVAKYDAESNNSGAFEPGDDALLKWDFDAFEWAQKCGHIGFFEGLSQKIAAHWQIFDDGKIDKGAFGKLVRKVALLYRSPSECSYHNVTQAAERVQCFAHFMEAAEPKLLPHLDSVDRAAVLLSLLAADAGHPGLTNATLCRIRDPVAVRFSQKQVMENFSSQLVLTTMRQDDSCDVTQQMVDEEVSRFMDVFYAIMMATSMEKHSVAHLDERLSSGQLKPYTERADLIEIVAAFCHMADLANQARPAVPASRWTRAISDEMDREIEFLESRGLEGNKRKDRDRGKNQLMWCQGFVAPLFRVMGKLLGRKEALETLELNMEVLQAQCGM